MGDKGIISHQSVMGETGQSQNQIQVGECKKIASKLTFREAQWRET